MDPHAADDRAEHPASHGARPNSSAVLPGQQAASEEPDSARDHDVIQAGDSLMADCPIGTPWTTTSGGPAILWKIFFDTGTAALELADQLAKQCDDHGVTAEIKAVDEYIGRTELLDVPGLLCVFTSEPPSSPRPSNTAQMARIARDFRDVRQINAIDGFYPGSDRWHRVGVLEVFYTDHALEDPASLAIIQDSCATHPYTPGLPFTGDIFEVFQPGKARQVKEHDQLAAAHDSVWKLLRRWGIDTLEHAHVIRRETEHEVDTLDSPAKRAMRRPIPGVDHNQLWLVLHDTDARPPADPNKTDEQNAKAETAFVANSARAVRDLVDRLEATYEWFRQPEDLKRRGAQHHFARLYETLRTVTRSS